LNKSNGNIILVSTGAAVRAIKGMSPYCLSKVALKMFGDLISVEYPNIGTLSVTPGMVDTDMQAEARESGN
jgi:NAD(P)-dependent dehydrogenase (short-subunit alcohol dehydrogenase family)